MAPDMAQHLVELILARQLASDLAVPVLIVDAHGDTLFNEPAELIFGRRFDEIDALPLEERTAILAPRLEDGRPLPVEQLPGYVLRFESFSVRNGPDLFVYLSPSSTGYTDGALELGPLKASDGSFNYEVPAGRDISLFKSAVVWCRAFSVLFATAPLGTG